MGSSHCKQLRKLAVTKLAVSFFTHCAERKHCGDRKAQHNKHTWQYKWSQKCWQILTQCSVCKKRQYFKRKAAAGVTNLPPERMTRKIPISSRPYFSSVPSPVLRLPESTSLIIVNRYAITHFTCSLVIVWKIHLLH